MLSEISQVTKSQILHDFTYMKYLEEPNSQKQKVEQQLPGAGGRGNEELFKGYRVSSFQDETILKDLLHKNVHTANVQFKMDENTENRNNTF